MSLKVNCTPFARKKDMPKKLVIDELRSKLKWAIKEVAYAQGNYAKEREQDAMPKKATAKS